MGKWSLVKNHWSRKLTNIWRKIAIKAFVVLRILIGCLFVVSGFEKLIGPYQNFLYVIQNYEFLTVSLEEVTARVMPWGEFLLGVFLVLGLWLKWVLRSVMLLIVLFMVVVSQALIRGLPIIECGCFGELISLPLYGIIIFDSILLLLTGFLSFKEEQTSVFSLDRYLARSS